MSLRCRLSIISLVVVVCRIMWKKMRREKRGHQAEGGKLSHYEVAISGAGGKEQGFGLGWLLHR